MKFFSNVIVVLLFTITSSFSAIAYADYKKVVFANHTNLSMYFTVNGQCASNMPIEKHQAKSISALEVKQLCGENSTCVFQAHIDGCTGQVTGTMTITSDIVQVKNVPCFRVIAKAGERKIKLTLSEPWDGGCM